MSSNNHLDSVNNFDIRHPKWVCNTPALKWTWLFIFDFIFHATKRENSQGEYVRKVDNDSWAGRQFKKIHEASVDSLRERNSQYEYKKPIPLPTIDAKNFNKDFFLFWKKKINMPIVIKNYLKDAPILDIVDKENLINSHGQQKIQCIKNFTDNVAVGENVSLTTTTLADFLSSDEFEDYYINNFYGILKDQDFYATAKGKEIEDLEGKSSFLTQWFISRKAFSGSTLHCAHADNIFLNIKGKKEWYFIDRSYTPLLQPIFSKYAIYAVSELRENMQEDYYQGLCANYPYVKHIPIYRCVLEEGDVLFNPPFWWHRVQNLTKYTVGCATRYLTTKEDANSLAFTISSLYDAVRHPIKSALPSLIRASVFSRKESMIG